MSKTIYKPEFLSFLKQHDLGTPTAAIERLRCLGLRFQDSKVRDLVKHPDHGGQPGAYFHNKRSKRIIGGEWLGYDKLCELLLKARDRFNEANEVEPKQSKAEMVEAEVSAYEGRVVFEAVTESGTYGCRVGETSHGKESGNLWLKLYPKNGTDVGALHAFVYQVCKAALLDPTVAGHKVKVTTVLDCNFCQITVDSGNVRAAITAEVEKRLGEKQGALWMEGAPTPDEGDK